MTSKFANNLITNKDFLYSSKPNKDLLLSKRSSSNSSKNTDCTSSECSAEELSPHLKSKHQVKLERRHQNYEMKKKTEVNFLPYKLHNNYFFSYVELSNSAWDVPTVQNVPLLTALTSSGAKFSFLQITRPLYANNFTQRDTVIMAQDANSNIDKR